MNSWKMGWLKMELSLEFFALNWLKSLILSVRLIMKEKKIEKKIKYQPWKMCWRISSESMIFWFLYLWWWKARVIHNSSSPINLITIFLTRTKKYGIQSLDSAHERSRDGISLPRKMTLERNHTSKKRFPIISNAETRVILIQQYH